MASSELGLRKVEVQIQLLTTTPPRMPRIPFSVNWPMQLVAKNSSDQLSCLRDIPFATLNTNVIAANMSGYTFPVIDGRFLMEPAPIGMTNGRYINVPMIIGTNNDEASSFSLGSNVNTDEDRLTSHVFLFC
jgi:carboxylesterase type B